MLVELERQELKRFVLVELERQEFKYEEPTFISLLYILIMEKESHGLANLALTL